jgi:hypothetical protein
MCRHLRNVAANFYLEHCRFSLELYFASLAFLLFQSLIFFSPGHNDAGRSCAGLQPFAFWSLEPNGEAQVGFGCPSQPHGSRRLCRRNHGDIYQEGYSDGAFIFHPTTAFFRLTFSSLGVGWKEKGVGALACGLLLEPLGAHYQVP